MEAIDRDGLVDIVAGRNAGFVALSVVDTGVGLSEDVGVFGASCSTRLSRSRYRNSRPCLAPFRALWTTPVFAIIFIVLSFLAQSSFDLRAQTTAQITDAGRTAIDEHWARLEALKKAAADWPRS